jgi:CubicO group peptidase (beta-lactamase class C family)
MQVKILLMVVLAITVTPACHDKEQELISRFENNINEHSFDAERIHATGKKLSIQSRMAYYKTPGLSLAIINDYKIDWQRSYGFLAAGKADMVDGNSIFQAGSVSKFVTALVVMHYVGMGVFDLDADVNSYLKSWKIPRNEFTANKPVTLRLLLSHQSGLPSSNMDRDESRPMPGLVQILDAEPPAINKPAIPEFTPGSKWSYSNIGYVVIQLLLEDTFGRSLDELAREVVFGPLDMRSSTFDYPLGAGMRNREAMPHATEGEPRPAAQDSLARAQGGLMTTTSDMSRLLIELMNTFRGSSASVISKDTLREMLTKQADVPTSVFGFPVGMGLGVFVDGEGHDISMMHPGHNYPGTVFLVLAFPGRGQGMAIGINGNKGDRLEIEVAATLAEIYDWPGGDYFKQAGPEN